MNFAEKLYHLRKKEKMSQEEFAETFQVSRQAVQKWERGTSLPELSKVVEMAKFFGVSIDYLMLERQSRMSEELKYGKEILPDYEDMPHWEFYGSGLLEEYQQSMDEGLDVESYKALFEAVARLPQDHIKKELGDVIQKIVLNAPCRKEYPYQEPSGLEEIQALRKEYSLPKKEITHLKDKVHGAWLGRVCGCMLGKTVEGIRTEELVRFLKATDNFPMKRYILQSDLEQVDLSTYNFDFALRPYADQICAMPMDDDTNYTVLAQVVFETYGSDFTPENVATAWLEYQPKNSYCTAERVAFCNFLKGYRPPQTALHKNPYREWIGAQIRADYWGYIHPGNPEKAAEMAWRDASISHVKNGIYGEMFVAAMIAAAAQNNCMEEIILSGLAQIPYTSRLYEEIMGILTRYQNGVGEQECFDWIHSRYDEGTGYGWCHTNSNAMIVTAALLYGSGDFGKSICMAVETGFDTDCNGATVGSILGMANGAEKIDTKWTEPFHDSLKTSIFGYEEVKISERAELTLAHIERNKG